MYPKDWEFVKRAIYYAGESPFEGAIEIEELASGALNRIKNRMEMLEDMNCVSMRENETCPLQARIEDLRSLL